MTRAPQHTWRVRYPDPHRKPDTFTTKTLAEAFLNILARDEHETARVVALDRWDGTNWTVAACVELAELARTAT